MPGLTKYAWPDADVLVKLVKEYGQTETARRLGVPRSTLVSHLDKAGVDADDRHQQLNDLEARALEEVRRLAS